MLKQCKACLKWKDSTEFYSHHQTTDCLFSKCKPCLNEYRQNYRKLYPEKVRLINRLKDKKRRSTPEGRARISARKRRQYLHHPEKHRARAKVQRAILSGKLVRGPCEVCGDPKTHAHHEDYFKPLDVQWLCLKHHLVRHGMRYSENWALTTPES